MHHGTLECMAGEISHVIYAARVLTALQGRVSHHSYWVGTVFPDIYRLHIAHRYPTHPRPVTLSSIVGQNDFRTGMRVHSWIDETRGRYMHERRAYERLPWHPLLPYVFELLEDEVLYSAYDDWSIIRRALNVIHPDEITILHEQSQIEAWHRALERYFREAPSDESRIAFGTSVGISEATSRDANELLIALKRSGIAQEILNGYLGELERMLT